MACLHQHTIIALYRLDTPCIAWIGMKGCSKFLRILVTTVHFMDRNWISETVYFGKKCFSNITLLSYVLFVLSFLCEAFHGKCRLKCLWTVRLTSLIRKRITAFRSSRLQMFFKISVLKNFTIVTGKHLYWNLFLIKMQP